MAIELSDYMRRLRMLAKGNLSLDEQSAFLSLAFSPRACGIEDEMLRYMDDRPDATLHELHTYIESLCSAE